VCDDYTLKWNRLDSGIVIILLIILVAVVILSFSDIPELLNIPTELTGFQTFAVIVSFSYDMLPTVAQQFSLGAIHTELLQSGFDPNLFVVITAFALLGGQLILYGVGVIIRHLHKKISKGSIGNLAGKNHFLHKYHFLVYLIVPFVGILGDLVMIYSGHQRINLLKIIPFLIIGDFISASRWIYPMMAQLEISRLFGA